MKRPGSIMMTGLLWPDILEPSSMPLPLHRPDPTACSVSYLDTKQDQVWCTCQRSLKICPWGMGTGDAMLWDGYSLPLPQPDLIYHLQLQAGNSLAEVGITVSTATSSDVISWTLPLSSMAFHSFCWLAACYLTASCRQNMVPGWTA